MEYLRSICEKVVDVYFSVFVIVWIGTIEGCWRVTSPKMSQYNSASVYGRYRAIRFIVISLRVAIREKWKSIRKQSSTVAGIADRLLCTICVNHRYRYQSYMPVHLNSTVEFVSGLDYE